jgi:hypothetical protein
MVGIKTESILSQLLINMAKKPTLAQQTSSKPAIVRKNSQSRFIEILHFLVAKERISMKYY